MNHSFNVEIAKEYGLYEAIIQENMFFWITKNVANGQNYIDGHYWTYNSVKAFDKLFPYMSNATIRRVLQSLEKSGLIITGNYNKAAYDRTKWYALTDKAFSLFGFQPPAPPLFAFPGSQIEQMQGSDLSKSICSNQQMDLPESANGIASMSKPIPDINTDITHIVNNNTPAPAEAQEPASPPQESRSRKAPQYAGEFEKFWNAYPRREEKALAYKQWQARLNDGYTPDELITAAKAYAENCRRNHTEKRYTKQAKTFLGPNTPFLDWLPKGATAGAGDSGDAGRGAAQSAKPQNEDVVRQFEQLWEAAT